MSSQLIIESIYTDGACLGNPGAGGWGLVIYFQDGSIWETGNGENHTTNNRMEMQAAIAALQLLAQSKQLQPVTLYTDSEYVQKGITRWIKNWRKKGWKTSQGKPVINQDLWEILDRLNSPLVTWQHVRGHSGNEGNERCDSIARAFAQGIKPQLQQSQPLFEPVMTAPPNSLGINEAQQSNSQSGKFPVTELSDLDAHLNIYKDTQPHTSKVELTTMESSVTVMEELNNLSREERVNQLRNLIETLRIAEEIAGKGYLISSSELADLMDINASAVTSRGDNWPWRNWVVSRVRREGNQILWQLEKVD